MKKKEEKTKQKINIKKDRKPQKVLKRE